MGAQWIGCFSLWSREAAATKLLHWITSINLQWTNHALEHFSTQSGVIGPMLYFSVQHRCERD